MNKATAERVTMRKERNQNTVQAKVTENVQAGLGVSSVVVGVSIIIFVARDWATVPFPLRIITLAIGLGMIWFGVLSCIRFSVDEVRDAYQWYRLQERLVDEKLRVQQLQADNTELRREVRRLQSIVKTQEFNRAAAGARDVVKANDKFDTLRRNADELLSRWSQNLSYSRDATQMTRNDWEAAMRLLESAGLIQLGGPGNRQRTIVAESLTQAQRKVDAKLKTWEQFDATTFTPA